MRHALAIAYGLLVLAVAVLLALLVGVFGILPFAVLPRGRREAWTMRFASLWGRWVLHGLLWTRVERTGADPRPAGRGALYVCNHRSWLDPLVLLAHTRSNGLSKRSILYLPFIGLFGWLAGAIFFERSDPEDRKRARREVMELVGAGHGIFVFPEGTRSVDGRLRDKVYLTLPRDCWQAGLPVIPCAILDSEHTLPPHRIAAYPGQRCRFWVGEALQPDDFPDEESFAQASWQAVKDALARMEAAG